MRRITTLGFVLLGACDGGVGPPAPAMCEPPTGGGTEHRGTITADETWTAAASPHLVPSGVDVRATVTIEPCAVVRVGAGSTITVGDSVTAGRLVARGAGGVITVESQSATEAFGGVVVLNGDLDFEDVTIDRAGANGAAIDVRGPDDGSVSPRLRALHTRVVRSAGSGLRLQRGAGFSSDSTDLTITGSGTAMLDEQGHPIDIDPPGVATIPDGTYTGNRFDTIAVRTAWPRVVVDETFHDRGVPYRIAATFLMYDPEGGDLTLTIDPGVTMLFDRGDADAAAGVILGNLASGSEVRVVAAGTESAPITFVSGAASPAPGDWAGVVWRNAPATGNVISHATFAHAGGETGTRGFGCGTPENVGGLVIVDWAPAEAFVTGSTFRDTRGAGIVSGWRLAAGQTGVDLTADNVFENIVDYGEEGHCDVAEWWPDAPDCRVPRADGITCVGQ
ncbi:MAG: hypothetical protein ACK6CU_26875 [Deltaproteobacteria bacterium]|jgi:hypothetical protein